MKHINQRRYSYISYPQNLDNPDSPVGKDGTIRSGGCGLCCACMVVEQLTTEEFSVRECTELAIAVGANHCLGANLRRLGAAVAEKFNLDYATTNDMDKVLKALHNGGRVIALVSAKQPGNKGIFTKSGHYITLISADENDEICILDPSWTSQKYKKWIKKGLVRAEGTMIYTTPEILMGERKYESADFFIFRRKKGNYKA